MNIHYRHYTSGLASTAAVLLAIIFSQAALGVDTRVDLMLENGTVLVYKAKEAGYKEGQQLDVVRRGGDKIGTIQIIKVMPAYAQAKILTGADAIRELDMVVVPGTILAAAPDDGVRTPAASKAPEKATPAADGKAASTTPAPASSAGSRRGGSSAESGGGETTAAAPAATPAPASSSGSSRRRGAAASSAPAEATTDAGSAGSSSSSRRGGRGGASKPAEDTEAPETPAEAAPKVLGVKPYYVAHAGYFYLKEDMPGVELSNEPGLLLGIDLWKPMKKNTNLVTGVFYTRPSATFFANGRYQRYQFKIMQYSLSYLFTDTKSAFGGTHNMYGGLGAGYRSSSVQIFCDITCDGTSQFQKKSLTGMDYHGIIGMRFHKSMELKFDYCFDEDYYTLDLGYRY